MLSFTHSRWLSVEIECYEIPHALFLIHIELQSKVLSESLVLKKRNSRERMKYPYSSCLSLPSLPSRHMSLSCPSKTTTWHESFWSFTAWKGLSMFRQQRHMQRTKGSGSGSSSSSNEQRTRSRRRQLMLNPKMHQSHERNDASCFPTGTPLIHEGWRERRTTSTSRDWLNTLNISTALFGRTELLSLSFSFPLPLLLFFRKVCREFAIFSAARFPSNTSVNWYSLLLLHPLEILPLHFSPLPLLSSSSPKFTPA